MQAPRAHRQIAVGLGPPIAGSEVANTSDFRRDENVIASQFHSGVLSALGGHQHLVVSKVRHDLILFWRIKSAFGPVLQGPLAHQRTRFGGTES
jgi:hypothetical protein